MIQEAIRAHKSYICHETQALQLALGDEVVVKDAEKDEAKEIEIDNCILYIVVEKYIP